MKKQILEHLNELIDLSLKKSGRMRADLKLIAVSKLQSIESMREFFELGISVFGENYLQESKTKQDALQDLKIEWHFIGQIQSKKAKEIVGNFEYVHSVDRQKVAEKLNSSALEKGIRQKILVEVNLAAEESKGGVAIAELESFIRDLQNYRNLQVCGLMALPPATEDPEWLRPYFAQARDLLKQIKNKNFWNESDKLAFKELSMGTSQDFHVAIEEGATMVRLGTVLFGARPEQKELL